MRNREIDKDRRGRKKQFGKERDVLRKKGLYKDRERKIIWERKRCIKKERLI